MLTHLLHPQQAHAGQSDAVLTKHSLLRHTLEDIAEKLDKTLPTRTTKLGAQLAGPVLKLNLDELLTGSKKF